MSGRGRRLVCAALLALAASAGAVLAFVAAGVWWWSREAPKNPYEALDDSAARRPLHDPWDFYCHRRIHGEPYSDARCPVCRPPGGDRW